MSEPVLQGVTFDFWNTLVHEDGDALVPARLDAIIDLLAAAGAPTQRSAVAAAHEVVFARYQSAWVANQQFVIEDAASMMADHLGLDTDLVEVLLEGFRAGGRMAQLRLCEGAAECLTTLRHHGVKTAIICDIGLTPSSILLERLEQFGLYGAFDAFVFSDVIGHYKPDLAPFTAALAGLGGAVAGTVAHVGDRRRTDVAGAAAAGLLPVRYRGVFDDTDEALDDAPIVVDHLLEVPVALGFG